MGALVFLIDDDPMSNVFNSIMISRKHPTVEILSFTNAEDALANLKGAANKKPDIIFLDLNMPVLNGWDFMEEFQEMGLTIDVAMLTSSNDIEDMARSKDYNVIKFYVIKPIAKDVMEQIMEKFNNV